MNSLFKWLGVAGLSVTIFGGCAVLDFSDGVRVSTRSANYTDSDINFTMFTTKDKNLYLGSSVNKFSDGGVTGSVCCGVTPKPGGMIKISWSTSDNKWGKNPVYHVQNVVISGPANLPEAKNGYYYLIVRFFPKDEVEAELVDNNLEPSNLRMDKLFFGIKQMRHKGE